MTLLSLCCARNPSTRVFNSTTLHNDFECVYKQYMNAGYAQVLGYSRVYMHGTPHSPACRSGCISRLGCTPMAIYKHFSSLMQHFMNTSHIIFPARSWAQILSSKTNSPTDCNNSLSLPAQTDRSDLAHKQGATSRLTRLHSADIYNVKTPSVQFTDKTLAEIAALGSTKMFNSSI